MAQQAALVSWLLDFTYRSAAARVTRPRAHRADLSAPVTRPVHQTYQTMAEREPAMTLRSPLADSFGIPTSSRVVRVHVDCCMSRPVKRHVCGMTGRDVLSVRTYFTAQNKQYCIAGAARAGGRPSRNQSQSMNQYSISYECDHTKVQIQIEINVLLYTKVKTQKEKRSPNTHTSPAAGNLPKVSTATIHNMPGDR